MNYPCKCDGVVWQGTLVRLDGDDNLFLAHVNGRSTGIDIIGGHDTNGAPFICLPAYSVGCRTAKFRDTFWNYEYLTPLIGEVDATTVAQGLRVIDVVFHQQDIEANTHNPVQEEIAYEY